MIAGQHSLCRSFLSDQAFRQGKALKASESGSMLRTEQYLRRSAEESMKISAIAHIHCHWTTLIKRKRFGEENCVLIRCEVAWVIEKPQNIMQWGGLLIQTLVACRKAEFTEGMRPVQRSETYGSLYCFSCVRSIGYISCGIFLSRNTQELVVSLIMRYEASEVRR